MLSTSRSAFSKVPRYASDSASCQLQTRDSRFGALACLVGEKACHLGALHRHGRDNRSCSSVGCAER